MLNLKQIQAFVTVADLGSFRRAADRLNTTQPNISTRIAQLEQALGVVLMQRDAGSVRLTAKGTAMLAAARDVLAAVDGFVTSAGDSTLFDGVLRLGVSELVAHTWLRAFLLQMKAVYPAVVVELTVDLSAALSQALFARDLDLVFQNGPFDRRARHEVALGTSDYVWVAAPSLGLGGQALTPATLADHRILTHARHTAPYRQLQEHFRDHGVTARLVPASNIAAGLQMTIDGLGLACLPRAMILRDLTAGHLEELSYGWHPEGLRFAARSEMAPLPPFVAEAMRIAQALSPAEDNVHLS
ncbi:MAG: LysR family transcriptional regulator [Paracoccaceae bacterium]